MNLGDTIHAYRKEHGMTIEDFGNKAGLTKGYVSMLERNYNARNGKEVTPSIRTYTKCAIAMEMEVDELLRLVDSNSLVAVASTQKEERLYFYYKAIAQMLDLKPNDIALAIELVKNLKHTEDAQKDKEE